jgi:hypothetical protein
LTLHLGTVCPVYGGGKAVRTINKPGSGFLGQECYLFAQEAAVRGDCSGGTDIGRWARKYETGAYTGTADHGRELREGVGGCRFEMEIVPGLAIGVWNCGVTCGSERYTDDTAETRFQAGAG